MAFGAVFPPTGAIQGALTDNRSISAAGGGVTFTACALGTPSATRVIAVVVVGFANAVPTSVTIGGVSAAQQVSQQNAGGLHEYTQVYSLVVSSGTSADIVVTGQSSSSMAIGVYALQNANGATAFNTSSSVADPSNLNLTAAGGGFTVGGMCAQSGTSSVWSGLNSDFDITNATARMSTASGGNTSAGALTISCSQPSGINPAAAAATWGPR